MPKTNRKLHDGHFTISQKIYWEFKKQTNKKTPQPTTTKPTQKKPHHTPQPRAVPDNTNKTITPFDV